MISGLRGKIAYLSGGKLRIDTGAAEYEVSVPLNVSYELEKTAAESGTVFLHIHHQFTQDGQKLYGFLESSQRDFFAAMQSVKGVGSSLALSLLSHTEAAVFLDIIEKKDVAALTKIPRIGKTTAETLVFEIGRKIDKWKTIISQSGAKLSPESKGSDANRDGAVEALVQLGYKEAAALKAVISYCEESGKEIKDCTEADMIRGALKYL